MNRIKTPFTFIVFGASGDLAKLKIFPALYTLFEQKKLPSKFSIIGFARTKKSQENFRQEFSQSIQEAFREKEDPSITQKLLQHVYYYTGQYDQLQSYTGLNNFLKKHTSSSRLRLAYFSVPPNIFSPIIDLLHQTKDQTKDQLRLILEKPFGDDEKTASQLFHFMASRFDEEQIFLLDHYLGKTGVQSLLTMRHANPILNHILRPDSIANIQITAWENFGIKGRVGYFENIGIIKDMIQSHLLQVLAMISMPIPITNTPISIHRERLGLLSSLYFEGASNLTIGQYQGYRSKPGVDPKSTTETYAALKLQIDKEYWHNIPIYLRTGKKVHKKATYIVIEIKPYSFQKNNEATNRFVIEIQPTEKLSIHLVNHPPSQTSTYQEIIAQESIACHGQNCLPEHATLLMDIFNNNRRHFLTFPEIITSWRLIDSILATNHNLKKQIEIYPDHSTGPLNQHQLTKQDNFNWYDL